MEKDVFVKCPICGKPHRLIIHDPYDGRMGGDTTEYLIICGEYSVKTNNKNNFKRVEITCE